MAALKLPQLDSVLQHAECPIGMIKLSGLRATHISCGAKSPQRTQGVRCPNRIVMGAMNQLK
jgi:hypothetical protein